MTATFQDKVIVSRKHVHARAELEVLRRYDELRSLKLDDYGGGQRWKELRRRERHLDALEHELERELRGRLRDYEPTADQLRQAFTRVGLPRWRRIAADGNRRGWNRAARNGFKCWEIVATELELRVDNPPRRPGR